MNKIDLHIHSKFSNDGEFTISEIIHKSINEDLKFMSITDHNSSRSAEEALIYSKESGITFIPGIEIDCIFNDIDIHLLGYNINYKSENFKELENNVIIKTREAFSQMIENLQKLGFITDSGVVLDRAGDLPPSTELIAEVMLSDDKYYSDKLKPYMPGGIRSDMPYINFYLDYFAQGKPAYVKIDFMDYKDAVELIMDNGGIPVVAHPGLNLKGKEELISKILEKGAEGLEVFNNYHDVNQIEFFAELAVKQNVIMTAGSDFHGKTKPLIDIGKYKFDDKYNNYLSESINKIIDHS